MRRITLNLIGSRRAPIFRRGAGPRSPRLVKGVRSQDPGVCQPAVDSWSAWPAPDPSTGELIERSFAHLYDTVGMRRTHQRGHTNILKRLLIHAGLQSRARYA